MPVRGRKRALYLFLRTHQDKIHHVTLIVELIVDPAGQTVDTFCNAASRAIVETFNAVAADAGVAGVAALDETIPLDVGASEELVGGAPAPNCPARKTWAALVSFDLISGAAFDEAVDSVVGVDAVGGAGADVDIKLLPAAVAGAALPPLVTCTLTAKLPLQAGMDCPFTLETFTPKKR
jgi:hypothetical protein